MNDIKLYQSAVDVMVVLEAEPKLLEVVRALHTTSGFTRRLNGGKKQADQNADDRDDDQQFDEGKSAAAEFSPGKKGLIHC